VFRDDSDDTASASPSVRQSSNTQSRISDKHNAQRDQRASQPVVQPPPKNQLYICYRCNVLSYCVVFIVNVNNVLQCFVTSDVIRSRYCVKYRMCYKETMNIFDSESSIFIKFNCHVQDVDIFVCLFPGCFDV